MLRCPRSFGAGATLFVAFVLPVLVLAQPQTADELVAHARQAASEHGPRVALPELERALALYQQQHNRRGEAISLGIIGNCYENLADYPRALQYLGRSLEMKKQLGDRLEEGKTLSNIGLVYWDMADFPKATDHYKHSLAIARDIRDKKLEATVLNNLGLVYTGQGDYLHALASFRQALPLQRSIRFEQGESDTLGNIGGVYLDLGQYGEAIKYFQQALEMDRRLKLQRSESLDLGNFALCQTGLGQLREAIKTYDRALAVARESGFKKDESDWHKGKGAAYAELGKYDLARAEYEQAVRVYEDAGLKRELVEALEDDGALHELLGDSAGAEKDFRRALELSQSIGHPRGVTTNLLALGRIEGRRRRYEQAATLYRDALERAVAAGLREAMAESLLRWALVLRDEGHFGQSLPKALQALDIARSTGAKLQEAHAQYVIGESVRRGGEPQKALQHYLNGEEIVRAAGDTEIAWKIAFGKGQAFEALKSYDDALTAYRQSVGIIEGVCNQLSEERFQSGYIEDKSQVYVALVRLLLKTGKVDLAFHYAEKMRARSYANLLERNQAPVVSTAEAELRSRIRQLQRGIEEEESKLLPEQKRQKLAAYSSELNSAEREYQALLDDLRGTHPSYAAARALVVPATQQIQSLLDHRTALIEYVTGEDCLAVFVLTRSRVRAKVLPISSAALYGKVELFRDLLGSEGNNDWVKPAESLWRDLIRPIEQERWLDGITRLYMVPHAALHYLPFAALGRPDAKGFRFLVQDYELAYLPAASAIIPKGKRSAPAGKLLALAPAVSNLRYAKQEAHNVGASFGTQSLILVDRAATKSAFSRESSRFELIHLATHGFFDQVNPMFSGVQLQPEGREDGRMEVHEILRLHLNARLVTLSGCETALSSGYFSEYPAGDDLVGLTRAFLFAGSSDVLASLWAVNDRSTSEFMTGLYGKLQGSQVAAALRKTQLAMLESDGRYRHPYYWAPFVLVGTKN